MMHFGSIDSISQHSTRTEESDISERRLDHVFSRLPNCPIKVTFSGRAIRKVDQEYRRKSHSSTIQIFATMRSGKSLPLLGINSNFFGRVQKDRMTALEQLDYWLKPYSFDLFSFEGERSLAWIDETGSREEDIVSSFGAKYLLGQFFAAETHMFVTRFFSDREGEEMLHLKIGVNEADESWNLEILQKEVLNPVAPSVIPAVVHVESIAHEAAARLEETKKRERSPEISIEEPGQKKAASISEEEEKNLECPITHMIMDDPVIAPDTYTYERSAISRWLRDKGTSPMTGKAMPSGGLISNRALKDCIAAYRAKKG